MSRRTVLCAITHTGQVLGAVCSWVNNNFGWMKLIYPEWNKEFRTEIVMNRLLWCFAAKFFWKKRPVFPVMSFCYYHKIFLVFFVWFWCYRDQVLYTSGVITFSLFLKCAKTESFKNLRMLWLSSYSHIFSGYYSDFVGEE